MSRIEENKVIVDGFREAVSEDPKGSMSDLLAWHLFHMNVFLMDISKSLAVIADKAESED
jgi:hypothetical protein